MKLTPLVALALLHHPAFSEKKPGAILKYDFGPEKQGVFLGVVGVPPGASFSPERGFGFQGTPKAVAGKIPDPLVNDSVLSATFEVRVPDGDYEVGVWTGYMQASGNYIFSQCIEHIVRANGSDIMRLKITPDVYAREFFYKHREVDVTPRTDLWKTFIHDWFPYHQATVKVTDGKLIVKNDGAAYLTGLIICPAARKDELADELKKIASSRRQTFSEAWLAKEWRPAVPPKPTEEEKELGYIPFLPN
ncbi:MAG: hypothetical protein QF886_24460, partial [Planctomycetota bacterium]|nr:hypothetical protein [Planctomycetota bacterium]